MKDADLSSLRKWLIAIRPFALPASTTPVLFGTTAAVVIGGAPFNPLLFLLALLAMVILHSGANLLGDVNDFRKGLDRAPTPASGAIVRGLLTTEQVRIAALSCLAVGSMIGLVIAARVGWPIVAIGAVGVATGFFYTVGPASLKQHALGDLAVFLDFGILGALGAWTVQTGELSWLPVVWAIPMSLLVIGILHANNWRDIATDGEAHVVTVASLLGDRGSLIYYGFLVFGPFAYVLTFVVIRFAVPGSRFGMPAAFLVVLLALPLAIQRWKRALRRHAPAAPFDFVALDGATAQLNLAFGLLCTVALILHRMIERSA